MDTYVALDTLAGLAFVRGYVDASSNLRHYVNNTGEDQYPRIDHMLNEIPGFRENAEFQINALRTSAYNLIKSNYDGVHNSFTISLPVWELQTVRSSNRNWYYAMGDFSYTTTALVTMEHIENGDLRVRLNTTLHVFDRYNWDAGKFVTILGYTVPDEQVGRLHQTGLAREYEIRGSWAMPVRTFTMRAPPPHPH